MTPSPPFPSPQTSSHSSHPGIIGERRGSYLHSQNAEQPNGEYLLHLLQAGSLQNGGNGERYHSHYNFSSPAIVTGSDIPMPTWDPAVAALGPSHSFDGLGGSSERDYHSGLYRSQYNPSFVGGWSHQSSLPSPAVSSSTSSSSLSAVDHRLVQGPTGSSVVPASDFPSVYGGMMQTRFEGPNPHPRGFLTESDISPNSPNALSSHNGTSNMLSEGGYHQQFFGDGAELMKLLQISSSKSGGPLADPKSEKQSVAIVGSAIPVQKPSPAIVHGPIGPPKRSEPLRSSPAYDLLGRFWPAPASTNGSQETNSIAKPVGFPYKENHTNLGTFSFAKDGVWWADHSSDKKFDSFGGNSVRPSLARSSPRYFGSVSKGFTPEFFESHEGRGLLGGWGVDLFDDGDSASPHSRKNRGRDDLYVKTMDVNLNSARHESVHDSAGKESDLECSREMGRVDASRSGGGRRSTNFRGDAGKRGVGRTIGGQWVAVHERQRERDGIDLIEGGESGSDRGSNSAGNSCKEELVAISKEGIGSQKTREDLKRRRGQQQEWRMKTPMAQTAVQPPTQVTVQQAKPSLELIPCSDNLELINGNHRTASPSKVRPLASQVDHPGLPSSAVADTVFASEPAVDDAKKVVYDQSLFVADRGTEDGLAKEEEEELREAFAGYLDLVTEPDPETVQQLRLRFNHLGCHEELDYEARSEQLHEFRRHPQRALANPSLRPDVRYRPDLGKFTSQMLVMYQSLIPPEEEEQKRRQFLSQLDQLIAREWPGAQLFLFGSCANAFGVCNSDIDVCLAVNDDQCSKADLVLKMASILRSASMQNVQALTHARVPIVKFMDATTGMACDICVNNMLAVVNSKLLHDYSQIDPRLCQLAFLVKHWAKRRQVNETYRGTLSSYAYVLMCIHFLQQRKPPILPCLQEMRPTYRVLVSNIECAYYDQVESLQLFGASNKETLGELLTSFFEYWAFRHDYNRAVVSVRTGGYLSKDEKEWTRRIGNERHLICIEDPFETSHDLGRVVDRHSIRVLRDEFHRAAKILRHDLNPCTTLFEPFVREKT